MNQILMLREFLRLSRRLKRSPTAEGFKRFEYLRFVSADNCPDCGEEAELENYICTRDKHDRLFERYKCPHCGSDFVFPQESVH